MTSYKLKLLQFFSSSHPEVSLLTIEPFISKSCFIYHAKFQIFKYFVLSAVKAGLIVYIVKKGGNIFDVTCNVIAAPLACVLVIVIHVCSTNTREHRLLKIKLVCVTAYKKTKQIAILTIPVFILYQL